MPEELRGMTAAADGERQIQRMLRAWRARELFVYGAWQQTTGAYVGEAYLANPDWRVPSLEVGYFIVAQQTGRGFAHEAGAAVVAAAFEHAGVARIDLECRADNGASAHVAERLGFRLEGRQLWYGLLRCEWEAQRRSGTGTGR
jgi:RimJ/RimL family protein N-acetyltransferase